VAFRHSDAIEVKRIPGKGRGVFALRRFRKGEVIERVPVLVLPANTLEEGPADSRLADYCFVWGRGTVALALGYGSLYNHSYRPNARYDDTGPQTKVFSAIREIEPGEEITEDYRYLPYFGQGIPHLPQQLFQASANDYRELLEASEFQVMAALERDAIVRRRILGPPRRRGNPRGNGRSIV
jgi:hypothetical protein